MMRHPVLLPADPLLALVGDNKDQQSRVRRFAGWLMDAGLRWDAPDLAAYRDHLLAAGLKPTSVASHLATVRGVYRQLLRDNRTRDALYALTSADATPSDRKAVVDEALARLQNAVAPEASAVRVVTSRDRADTAHLRLTVTEANTLLEAPGVDTPIGLRDTAIVALLLCTGIREMELCRLDVPDLRQTLGGALALHVRDGKGAVERLVPYGALDWCLAYVEKWLDVAGIGAGAVFRGFYKGGKRVRDGRLTVRAVEGVLDRYPIVVEGRAVAVNPHDLRRTYARRLYEAGTPLLAIQQNLGHADARTTERYIGTLDAGARQPPALFRPPHIQALRRLTT